MSGENIDLEYYFNYNKETGNLLWRVPSSKRTRVGDKAGSVDKDGSLRVTLNGKQYSVHKVIWKMVYGQWPSANIYHVNENPSDNRIDNLKEYRNKVIENRNDLTSSILKSILYYDPSSGKFYWKERTSSSNNPSKEAGTTKNNRKVRYRVIRIDGVGFYAHRLAWLYMTGEWPRCQVDHRDGDGLNNKWKNLRECNNSENSWNTSRYSDNTSGHKNIFHDKKYDKWVVIITAYGKRVFTDRYDCLHKAKEVAEKMRELHHGDFCNHGVE